MKHKRQKKKKNRQRFMRRLPPKPHRKVADLPENERGLMRNLIFMVVTSYPKEIFENVGLEGTLESAEKLIDGGWIKLTREPIWMDPIGYNDHNFWYFQLWHPNLHRYVIPGSPETLIDDPRYHWPERIGK